MAVERGELGELGDLLCLRLPSSRLVGVWDVSLIVETILSI